MLKMHKSQTLQAWLHSQPVWGFEILTPSLFYRINLFVNFMDLIWMYSLSKGTFSVPKLWKAKKACITGAKLVENKKQLEELYNKLKTKTALTE